MMHEKTTDSTASFGIDHPLIAVHDIDTLRQRLISIGFNMTAIGQHPWGTNTSLAIFSGCLLEIMGIYDETLLDEKPAGNFHFGRHVFSYLQQREGIALTALYSTDSIDDAQYSARCGFDVAGHLEFGRDVTLPSGEADRTRTTLALLPDKTHPRLSFFLCQQHRRDLVEVHQWKQHPNTVSGIHGITIMASMQHQKSIRQRLGALYGNDSDTKDGFCVQTPNGTIKVLTSQSISQIQQLLATGVLNDNEPGVVGMEFHCNNLKTLERFVRDSDMDYTSSDDTLTLIQPQLTGNTVFTFRQTVAHSAVVNAQTDNREDIDGHSA